MEAGKCIIVSAPSGAGKTTIVKHLLEKESRLEFSVSATSRPPRPNEEEGRDYYFFSPEEFKAKIEEGAFVEWEEVYQNQFYGTLHSELERIWQKGKTVIFDVDVVGGSNLKKIFGDQAFAIFIAPPTLETLAERLRGRSTESEESLKKRLAKAEYEMSFRNRFDHVLVNDVLAEACAEADQLIQTFLDT
jgi:guanylate kinase